MSSNLRVIYVFIHIYFFYHLFIFNIYDVCAMVTEDVVPYAYKMDTEIAHLESFADDENFELENPEHYEKELENKENLWDPDMFDKPQHHMESTELDKWSSNSVDAEKHSYEEKPIEPEMEPVIEIENDAETVHSLGEQLESKLEILEQMESMAYRDIFLERSSRAQAYVYCCQKQNSHENDQLESFLTTYSSSERQKKFLEDCADKLNEKQSLCHNSLIRAEYFHKKVENLMEFAWKKNATTIQEDFQKLDDATTKTDRIFTNLPIYHQMTRKSKSCDHALILLWDPSKFIDCVQSMFLLVKKNAMSIDEYEKFAELQADMIDSAQTMILEIMHVWIDLQPYVFEPTKLWTEKDSKDKIKTIRERFLPFQTMLQQPMITYQTANAVAFRSCCEEVNSYETMSIYLTNINEDPASDAMPKLFQKCLEISKLTNAISYPTVEKHCRNALAARQTAIEDRRKFIKDHEEKNPNLEKNYQQAIGSKLIHGKIFKRIETTIEYFCGHQHIFDLLFDANNLVECETLIYRGLVNEEEIKVKKFDEELNQPFLEMIFNDWIGLEKAHSKSFSTYQGTGKTYRHSSWSTAQKNARITSEPERNPTFSAHPRSTASISSRCFHLVIISMVVFILS